MKEVIVAKPAQPPLTPEERYQVIAIDQQGALIGATILDHQTNERKGVMAKEKYQEYTIIEINPEKKRVVLEHPDKNILVLVKGNYTINKK